MENWEVGFIRSDGEEPNVVRDGFRTRDDAEYFGQCRWAGPEGRGVSAVRVRSLPGGPWQAVIPASVCGGVRLPS